MFSREELEAVFNILVERPFKEVALLIGRIQQEYAALPASDPDPVPEIDVNQSNVGG